MIRPPRGPRVAVIVFEDEFAAEKRLTGRSVRPLDFLDNADDTVFTRLMRNRSSRSSRRSGPRWLASQRPAQAVLPAPVGYVTASVQITVDPSGRCSTSSTGRGPWSSRAIATRRPADKFNAHRGRAAPAQGVKTVAGHSSPDSPGRSAIVRRRGRSGLAFGAIPVVQAIRSRFASSMCVPAIAS